MQNVSPTYLSKILTKLTKEGMIHSSSGQRAVTRLVRIGRYFILDIIHAIEGKTSLFDCCLHDKPGCLINEAMLAAEEKMEEELRNQKS